MRWFFVLYVSCVEIFTTSSKILNVNGQGNHDPHTEQAHIVQSSAVNFQESAVRL